MSDDANESPLQDLGSHLKDMRRRRRESRAEAAGAVEIDEPTLARIEQGRERPTEDILLLLISHFDLPEEEADHLWELAGYEPSEEDDDEPRRETSSNREDQSNGRNAMLVLAVDPRIVYSDGVHIVANSRGVVMNFVQSAGTPQALTTARIGMSRTQAHSVLSALQSALKDSEPRQLPESTQSSKQDKSSDKPAA
ncbi:MAG TPA: helix-turn-helix transcriptional regulator [Candidatus Saccharimonadales bacterium]